MKYNNYRIMKIVSYLKNPKGLILRLFAIGNDFYHIAPKSIKWFFWPMRLIHKTYKKHRLDFWMISGKEISCGQELSIMYAGCNTDKNYFAELAFGDSFEEIRYGAKWRRNIIKEIQNNKLNYSIAIMEIPYSLLDLSNKLNWFSIPNWIYGELDIPFDKDYFFKKNTSIRSDMRKINKNQLSYVVTRDILQLKNFYYNMYIPYIKKVFGDRAYICDYSEVKRDFIKQTVYKDLLLIKKDNDYIAGCLLDYKQKWAKLCTLGIKDGSYEYVKDGAIGAIYYFSIEYFEKCKFNKVNLGGSKSFLKDGVLQFKKKWKPALSRKPDKRFMIKMLRETEGLKGFCINNPFIYEDASGLNGAVFIEDNKSIIKEDYERIFTDYYQPGISKLVIYKFDKSDNNIFTPVPAELSDKVEVRSVYSVFGINPRD
jgi:hypothetical protein